MAASGSFTGNNICIFSHYFDEDYIPVYVLVYLKELKNYFDEILLITNLRKIKNAKAIEPLNISLMLVENEGYDFGMFYKGFQKINYKNYDQIACINDSNVVFGNLKFLFDWGENQQVDFWGLVDSYQKPTYSTHQNNYHLQSHFIVFNKNAVELLPEFFSHINFEELFTEKNISRLKKKIIINWEIGLTQFLIHKNLTCKAYLNSKEYSLKYKNGKPVNVPTKLYAETIARGVPILKKRVITSTDLRHNLTWKGNWKRLIRRYGDRNFEVDSIIGELSYIRKKHIQMKLRKILSAG
ncbi:MAG: rhamnan synthesis F family protein [Tangfeifania sp.]